MQRLGLRAYNTHTHANQIQMRVALNLVFVLVQIFINVPWWYLAVNRMISPFLTQRSKSKFVFAGPSKSTETLLRWEHKVSNFALSLWCFGLVYGFDVSVSLHFQLHSSGTASGEIRWIKQRWGDRKYRCCHRNHSEGGVKAYRWISSNWGWLSIAFFRTGFWESKEFSIGMGNLS